MFFKRKPKKIIRTDEELLLLYRESGNMDVLGELFERYMHLIFGVCHKYLKDKEESKDMTMLIFEKLVIELKKQEVKNFKSWIHVLSKNQCLMLLRSPKYRAQKGLSEINDDPDMEFKLGMHPIDEDKYEKDLEELERAVEHLPPEQKLCIRMFFIEQKCYKEIAEVTSYDLKKVKSYIQNGKRNLKGYLNKVNEEE